MNTRRIIIQQLSVQASIGVLEHERRTPQAIIIDASFDCAITKTLNDNDINSVLDYRTLHSLIVKHATSGHIDLLETLLERCLNDIKQRFPEVCAATLRICKPQAFADCSAVCLEQGFERRA